MPRDNCWEIRLCVTESVIPEFYTLIMAGAEPKMVCHDVFSYWRFKIEHLHLLNADLGSGLYCCAAFRKIPRQRVEEQTESNYLLQPSGGSGGWVPKASLFGRRRVRPVVRRHNRVEEVADEDG